MTRKIYSLAGKRIWVCGHRGMVGSAICRRLGREDCEVILVGRDDVDLTVQADVNTRMGRERPDVVVLAAARVGGIAANSSYPVDFLYDNLMIEANVMHASHQFGVEKLLFLGSSCIYPRLAPQPIVEDALLSGALEPSNEWYAIAKIAGIKLCAAYRQQYGADFISAMPTNMYGPGDNFHPENSHMPAALLARFHAAKHAGAKHVIVWGSGEPQREFLYVDDCAEACVFLLEHYSAAQHINIGTGTDLRIADFARLIKDVVGYRGELKFDTNRPDGTPRKVMDVSRINALGWQASTSLADGLVKFNEWYVENRDKVRAA